MVCSGEAAFRIKQEPSNILLYI